MEHSQEFSSTKTTKSAKDTKGAKETKSEWRAYQRGGAEAARVPPPGAEGGKGFRIRKRADEAEQTNNQKGRIAIWLG